MRKPSNRSSGSAERQDEHKLAAEIGSYVVTPTIEKYIDDFLEHYTDTFRTPTTEIGVWISGYFGSGKSHLAKIAALLAENRVLAGLSAAQAIRGTGADVPRPPTPRSFGTLAACISATRSVLAFNINTISDSRSTPLPRLLLSQYYQSYGYGSNLFYARVIEAELDRRGKLAELHAAAERLAKKPWDDIQKNPTFYAKALYKRRARSRQMPSTARRKSSAPSQRRAKANSTTCSSSSARCLTTSTCGRRKPGSPAD